MKDENLTLYNKNKIVKLVSNLLGYYDESEYKKEIIKAAHLLMDKVRYCDEVNITLEDVNTKIQEYFGKEIVDRTNLGYNYVDENNEVVVVGLIDNSFEKQDEFMHNVFSNCCGSTYIKYVQSKSMIKFVKTDPITSSNH